MNDEIDEATLERITQEIERIVLQPVRQSEVRFALRAADLVPAQRLRAIIEQRREAGEHNARSAENSALPQTERNRLRGMAEAREVDYRILRSALLNPPTSREADEESGDDHE